MRLTSKYILIFFIILISFGFIYIYSPLPEQTKINEPIKTVNTENPTVEYKKFTDSKSNIQFSYPSSWFGPETYNYDNGFRFEIGTDKVYPYGTGIEERTYTLPNSYYITVQFDAAPNSSPNSVRIDEISTMKDDDVKSDIRSETKKVSNLKFGDFSGVEFISTLSSTAQTERFYMREVLLKSKNGDLIRISGTANNVDIKTSDWKSEYKKIDEQYLPIFKAVVESITTANK